MNEAYMHEALALAREAARIGEVPVGALVVLNDKIIARAHNETEMSSDATAHAEILAIRRASNALGRWRLDGCKLFVTLEPCPMCIGAIILARVPELYFGCYDPRLGAVGSNFDLASHTSFGAKISVYPQLLESDCRTVLQDFFKSKR